MTPNFFDNYIGFVLMSIPMTIVYLIGIYIAYKNVSETPRKSKICIGVFTMLIALLYIPNAVRVYFTTRMINEGGNVMFLYGGTTATVVEIVINIVVWCLLINLLFSKKSTLNKHRQPDAEKYAAPRL